jgi:hypothetical protein
MSLEQGRTKKQKVEVVSPAAEQEDEDEDQEDGSAEVEVQRNSDGEAFFELSSTRRISVRKLKGKTLLDIREVREI